MSFHEIHPVLQGLIATTFTYLVTALGASLVFFLKNVNKKILDIMMGFSAGVMIAASFWSLLEPAIELAEMLDKTPYLAPSIGFACGGLFIIVSDILLGRKVRGNDKKSVLLTSAVTLHNIPEGMSVGVAFGILALGIEGASFIGALLLAVGIGIQNFPEGSCVSLALRGNGMKRGKAFFYGQISAIVEPIAGVVGVIFALTVQNILPFFLSFSAGAMIAVVCSELIPDSFADNKILASLGVIFGFIIMMVLDVALG